MKRRVFTKAFFFGLICSQALAADPLPTLQETSMFAERLKSGALPPVSKRIPEQPWVVKRFPGDDGPGRPVGQLNMMVSSARDTWLMTVYTYTRLLIYQRHFKLHTCLL